MAGRGFRKESGRFQERIRKGIRNGLAQLLTEIFPASSSYQQGFAAPSTAPEQRLRLQLAMRPQGEFTFERLYDLVDAPNKLWLAEHLADLVNAGELKQFVRVESPTKGGGIQDFDSILDVPPVIHDWRAQTDLEVTPDNIRLFYRLPDADQP